MQSGVPAAAGNCFGQISQKTTGAGVSSGPCRTLKSKQPLVDALPVAVEQVRVGDVGADLDGRAGLGVDALAEHADDALLAEAAGDLGFRAGRLDHHDFKRHAGFVEAEMLGSDAVG